MSEKPIIGEQRAFMTGNEVVAWACLAAQAEIMYGYPITPQNEIMHYWTRLAPKYGRQFLQTEDEISAGFTTVGGVLAGAKAFTGTGGPGNILMQESISMAEMMRIPTVMFIKQRGGPSTATVIYSQQEVTLTTYGGNGEGYRIVYSTATHQDVFDYTIKAFNVAWKYRFPTFILADGYQAKMRESLMIYDPESRGITMVPAEPLLGMGAKLDPAHLRNTYNTEEELYDVVKSYQAEYDRIAPEIVEYEAFDCADADVIVLSHGVVSRSAKIAVREMREKGMKVGYFRPITLRPFPDAAIRQAISNAKTLFVVESSEGQFLKLCKQSLYGMSIPIETLLKPGVGITSEELVEKLSLMR